MHVRLNNNINNILKFNESSIRLQLIEDQKRMTALVAVYEVISCCVNYLIKFTSSFFKKFGKTPIEIYFHNSFKLRCNKFNCCFFPPHTGLQISGI